MSDDDDETYVNDSCDVLMASGTLDEVLERENHKCEKEDTKNMWYHGKISRQEAEQLLEEAIARSPDVDMDGVFLVRDHSNSDVDFSLSFLHKTRCYHFFIKRAKMTYYCIDGGPTVHGLEKLLEHYMSDPGQLPTKLSKICKAKPPPPTTRKDGVTNFLHKAIMEQREDLAKKILNHPKCPDINAKNKSGSTALHDACAKGLDKTVAILLQKGVNMDIVDTEGNLPLHKAASCKRAKVCQQLITKDYHYVQEKNPYTGTVPLHLAARNGNYDCIDVLLRNHASLFPRALNNETPIELAANYGRKSCLSILESFKETNGKQNWFHRNIDRQAAEEMMKEQGVTDGLFLIRPGKTDDAPQVLSVCNDHSVRHYEIKSKDYRNKRVYFIDESPYHLSVETLVEYYYYFEDGLHVKLKNFVSSDIDRVGDVQALDKYFMPPAEQKSKRKQAPVGPPLPALDVQGKRGLPPTPPIPSPKSPATPATPSVPATPAVPMSPVSPPTEPQQEALTEILPRNLKKGCELGQGEYGSVLKGVLQQKKSTFLRKEKRDVAIKVFHAVNNKEDFKQEAYTMQSLKNEFIVELLGVCYGPPLMLVEEFLAMGSMLDFLEDQPQKVRVNEELCLWASQIAKGMMYLEEKRLVHRDLAARNILLHTLHHVKISDFGLSRAMGSDKEYYKASKGGRWPIKWYAPESINFGRFDHASDVWSYGVTLWEMFSYGMAPFESMSGVEVIKYIEDGNRLKQPDKCPNATYEMMKICWEFDSQKRPTFSSFNKHFDEHAQYGCARSLMAAKKQGK